MKKNYVLIDYENVQPAAVEALVADHFHVLVFVGANQTKVTYEIASSLQKLGERATYIKISGNGSNALDFHLAYYIGRLAVQEPDAYFHIVSKDTGFDPLLQHLKSQKILAGRVTSIADLPIVRIAASRSLPDRVSAVAANLAQRKAANPRTLKTLSSTINALFQKALSPAEVEAIIAELARKGIVSVREGKVSYALPGAT